MKRKSSIILLTLVLALGTLLAACSNNNKNAQSSGGTTTNGSAAAADQVLNINLEAEPPTLDPAQAQDVQAHTVLTLMYEGLTKMGADGKEQPGVAQSWDISKDGLTYTFHLRNNAKWSNGDPVTANDFVFAWQRVLNPSTAPAPPYAYQLYYIKNAQAYNLTGTKSYKGSKVTDFKDVGVKAVDDHTLEVKLENPTPFFLGLTSFYTYYPVHGSTVKGNDKWATNKDTTIVNGPFKLTDWTPSQTIEVAKNENYWDKDQIKLNKIHMSLVNSTTTALTSYQSGELDFDGKPTGDIPTDQMAALKQQLPDEFKLKGVASSYYYLFNVTEKPFNNVKIRKAFAMAIDRKAIVNNVIMGSGLPAYGFVPPGIKGNSGEFRSEFKDSAYFTEDLTAAKKLLAEGMAEEGVTKLPPVTLIYNSNEKHQKVALAIADMWKKNLGVDVQTQNQEWGVFLQNRRQLNYQIARGGWTADFNDPVNFLELFKTGAGNNDSGYSNPKFDALLDQAKKTTDAKARNEIYAKAEKLLIQDDMVVAPIYYYADASLTKPNVKGISVDFSGAIDLTRAYKTK